MVFTVSQHVVPRAPTGDSLDWLDDLDPSQSSQLHQQHQCRPSPTKSDTNDTIDRIELADVIASSTPEWKDAPEPVKSHANNKLDLKEVDVPEDQPEKEFAFVTPKAPPCRRRNRIRPSLCSTPNTDAGTELPSPPPPLPPPPPAAPEGVKESEESFAESMDLFDDLSIRDILTPSMSKSQMCSISEVGRSSVSSAQSSPVLHTKRSGAAGELGTGVQNNKVFVVTDSEEDEHRDDDVILVSRSPKVSRTSEAGERDDVILVSRCPKASRTSEAGGRRTANSARVLADEEIEEEEDYTLHCGKRRRKRVNFLESPLNESVKKKRAGSLSLKKPKGDRGKEVRRKPSKKSPVMQLDSDSDDDFCLPLRKRLAGGLNSDSHHKGNTGMPSSSRAAARERESDFIEREAELSQGEVSQLDQTMGAHTEEDGYDMEDSFINDNSMLTQYTPGSQRKTPHKGTKSASAAVGGEKGKVDMYRQSLVSPKDRVFGRRRCGGNGGKYRMVFSQRYHLLNHYMDKAGFRYAPEEEEEEENRTKKKKKRHGFRSRNKVGERRQLCSSGSEAEEMGVAYGEEDMEELSQSWEEDVEEEKEEEEEEGGEVDVPATGLDLKDVEEARTCHRNLSPELLDSEPESSHHDQDEGVAVSGGGHTGRTAFLSDTEIEDEIFAAIPEGEINYPSLPHASVPSASSLSSMPGTKVPGAKPAPLSSMPATSKPGSKVTSKPGTKATPPTSMPGTSKPGAKPTPLSSIGTSKPGAKPTPLSSMPGTSMPGTSKPGAKTTPLVSMPGTKVTSKLGAEATHLTGTESTPQDSTRQQLSGDSFRTVDTSRFSDIVISPSLLVSSERCCILIYCTEVRRMSCCNNYANVCAFLSGRSEAG